MAKTAAICDALHTRGLVATLVSCDRFTLEERSVKTAVRDCQVDIAPLMVHKLRHSPERLTANCFYAQAYNGHGRMQVALGLLKDGVTRIASQSV